MVVGLGTVHPTSHIVVGPVAHSACPSLFTLWKEDPKTLTKDAFPFLTLHPLHQIHAVHLR